jgi:hypothetical protein
MRLGIGPPEAMVRAGALQAEDYTSVILVYAVLWLVIPDER